MWIDVCASDGLSERDQVCALGTASGSKAGYPGLEEESWPTKKLRVILTRQTRLQRRPHPWHLGWSAGWVKISE